MSLFTGTEQEFKYRIPLVFYPLIGVCALSLFMQPPFDLAQLTRIEKGILIAIFAAGFTIRLWASSILTGSVVMDAKVHDQKLITTGPFSQVRHPLYTGAGLMLAAMAFFMPFSVSLGLIIFQGIIGLRLAKFEEGLMSARFGEKYERYRKNTGRFLPRLFLHDHHLRDLWHGTDLKSGFASEFVFGLYGISLAAALTLNSHKIFFWGVLVSSALSAVLVKLFLKEAKI